MNKQLYTRKVSSNTRDYFFDIKRSQHGSYYLAINEARKSDDGNNKRQCVLVFNNLLNDFSAAFAESMQKLSELDKTIIWDPRNTIAKATIINKDKTTKQFKELSPTEIKQQQQVNIRAGKAKNSGMRWSNADRQRVRDFYNKGEAISAIAKALHRSIPSITAEMMKQGLLDENTTMSKPF